MVNAERKRVQMHLMKGVPNEKLVKFETKFTSLKKQIWEKGRKKVEIFWEFIALYRPNNSNTPMLWNRFDFWAVRHNCLIALFIAF